MNFRMNHRSLLIMVLLFVLTGTNMISNKVHAQDDFVKAVLEAEKDMDVFTSEKESRVLLESYKPKPYVAPGSFLPMNFYTDYLPKTVLKAPDGTIVNHSPNKKDLRSYHKRHGYYLDYRVSSSKALEFTTDDVTPTFYGRILRDTFTHDNFEQSLLFLKYTSVFPHSGLAAEKAWWKEIGSSLAGDPYGWHELDIHGAIHVILRGSDCEPLGVLLAQHNYHRVHWRGQEFPWPDDNHPVISYAKYANEPYLIGGDRGSRTVRTVGNPRNYKYLYNRTDDAPLGSGRDVIMSPSDGAKPIKMKLEILPQNDPLYTSQISLGDKLNLFYFWPTWFREGPPGINFYAPPKLINLSELTAFSDIESHDDSFFTLLDQSESNLMSFPPAKLLNYQKKKMKRILRNLNEKIPVKKQNCQLDDTE